MHLGPYRLTEQLSAGPDGVAYRAIDDRDGRAVVLVDLGPARADPSRWADLLPALRRLALVRHPGVPRLLAFEADGAPPIAVFPDDRGPTLATAIAARGAPTLAEAAGWAALVAGAMIEAHRVGLGAGLLDPALLATGAQGLPRLDPIGLAIAPGPAIARPSANGPATDLSAFGRLLDRLADGCPDLGPLRELATRLVADDPAVRLTAREVKARLDALVVAASPEYRSQATIDVPSSVVQGPTSSDFHLQSLAAAIARPGARADLDRERLGRFRLVEKLGQGGMGTVYRAEDLADGRTVAIKILRPDWAANATALRRFQKEAKLLGEVNSPFVTNFLELNEDDGIHYLALEFVRGETLSARLKRVGRLEEAASLAIVSDVARALAVAHARGIVHRDVKPENILIVAPAGRDASFLEMTTVSDDGPEAPPPERTSTAVDFLDESNGPRVKLSDFGLARYVVESESQQITQAGALLGTPAFMAPEQAAGGKVDARADVYALGATLFTLLTGRPPFSAEGFRELIALIQNQPPPPLRSLCPTASEGLCRVVEKAMAKDPAGRYADADAFGRDLDRLRRGEPTGIAVHPLLPKYDPTSALEFEFRWDLDAAARQLWPHVTNTDRLNRAVGLPAAQFTQAIEPGKGLRRHGSARMGGLPATWEEHPFEWVEPRRFGVLRIFDRGPFRWFVSLVELEPRAGGGTTLVHRVRLEPRVAIMKPLVASQMKGSVRKALDRVYRRIDAAVLGRLGGAAVDPFEPPTEQDRARRARLEAGLDAIVADGADPAAAEALGDYLAEAPDQEVARLRPLALARRLGVDPDPFTAACLLAARHGLLVLMWDLLCPICRIPSEVKETLRALKEHGRCEACDLDYELDFGSSVELIFRAHPSIRDAELATYCVGGPAHSPHVVAQVRVAPGERIELDLALDEGAYRLRGPQLAYALDLRVESGTPIHRLDLDLANPPTASSPIALGPHAQSLDLLNPHDTELVVRVERVASRGDALTATRASTLALFRELFPTEILAPGRLASVANVTLLVTEIDDPGALYRDLGDARAFAVVHDHIRRLDAAVKRAGGAVVKTLGEGILAAFADPAMAVAAALDLFNPDGDDPLSARLRVGIHRGPAMAATLNDHLDYFGSTVNLAVTLPRLARPGSLILTRAVASDPRASAPLAARGIALEVLEAAVPGLDDQFVHRAVVRP